MVTASCRHTRTTRTTHTRQALQRAASGAAAAAAPAPADLYAAAGDDAREVRLRGPRVLVEQLQVAVLLREVADAPVEESPSYPRLRSLKKCGIHSISFYIVSKVSSTLDIVSESVLHILYRLI